MSHATDVNLRVAVVLLGVLGALLSLPAEGAIPPTMSYQGSLRDAGGSVPPDGPYAFVFKLYNVESGGTALWQESQTLPLQGGLFHATLGAVTPLNLPFDAQYWVETTVAGGVLTPRVRLASSPYAQRAAIADAVAGGGGGGIGGGGTTGYLSRFTGATTIGNSIAYESGGRVGIGTTSPGARLSVEGASTLDDMLLLKCDSPTRLSLQTTDPDGVAWLNFLHGSGGGQLTSYLSEDETGLRIIRYAPAGGIFLGSASPDPYRGAAIVAMYNGTVVADHVGIHAESWPADYYGIGGRFKGGYIGAEGLVDATGSGIYYGLRGTATGGAGQSVGVIGYAGSSGTNYAIYGTATGGTTNYAGYFNGALQVNGNLTVSGTKSFRIDHPLDPANRYLHHFCVESDEVLNTYSGNVVLDGSGEARVELPEWFDAVNTDPRYQLTCIGGYAPVYIAEEIAGRHFRIAGGTSGLKVSWQVTGVRSDPAAGKYRMPVEEEKPAAERGRYLDPELYGAPADQRVGLMDERARKANPGR